MNHIMWYRTRYSGGKRMLYGGGGLKMHCIVKVLTLTDAHRITVDAAADKVLFRG